VSKGSPDLNIFFFEKQWLLMPGLHDIVKEKWDESVARRPIHSYSLNNWHGSLCFLRRALRGWNIQKIGEQKKEKNKLLQQLAAIDSLADRMDLSAEQWRSRYELENKLEEIYNKEEIYWQQRGNNRWLLEGDNNSKNFICTLMGDVGKKPLSP
jgi:hypothetical protein